MEFYKILYLAHSGLRWVALLLVALTILIAVAALIRGGNGSRFSKIIVSSTVGTLDLMFLLGATMLVTVWINVGEPGGFRLEHGLINLVAIGLAHAGARNAPPSNPARARKLLIFFLLSAGLIVGAILRLPQKFGMTPAEAIGM